MRTLIVDPLDSRTWPTDEALETSHDIGGEG